MSGCRVVALEGTHGTGKSALGHALVAMYKARSVNAALVAETARRSAFVEASVIHHAGGFSLEAELQLFAEQIAEEQLEARYHELILCDKTLANVLGYARLLTAATERDQRLLAAMADFVRSYSVFYDEVIYITEAYDPTLTNDPFRPKDKSFQADADRHIRGACQDTGINLIELPPGLRPPEVGEQLAR